MKKRKFYLVLIEIIVNIRLIINRKIRTAVKAATPENPATTPQIINIQITLTRKNKLQLSDSDCLVDLVL